MSGECPFCVRHSKLHIEFENDVAFAMRDGFPVSLNHTLVIPKRHLNSIFDFELEELNQVWELVSVVSGALRDAGAHGINIGVNDGSAAGQTIEHAHVHVIPRYNGDVEDPRGGVRWVIPSKAVYWE